MKKERGRTLLTALELAWFALAALLLVLTPGPNMMCGISRAMRQGSRAGLMSLGGVVPGLLAVKRVAA